MACGNIFEIPVVKIGLILIKECFITSHINAQAKRGPSGDPIPTAPARIEAWSAIAGSVHWIMNLIITSTVFTNAKRQLPFYLHLPSPRINIRYASLIRFLRAFIPNGLFLPFRSVVGCENEWLKPIVRLNVGFSNLCEIIHGMLDCQLLLYQNLKKNSFGKSYLGADQIFFFTSEGQHA